MTDKLIRAEAVEALRDAEMRKPKPDLALVERLDALLAEAQPEEPGLRLSPLAAMDMKYALAARPAEDGLREAAYDLASYAAAIRWDGTRNTQEYLDGLRECIERVQALARGKGAGE